VCVCVQEKDIESLCERERACVFVRACVRERERERVCLCACVQPLTATSNGALSDHRFTLRDTAPPKEMRAQTKEFIEERRAQNGGQRPRNPVDAWPGELVFFFRVVMLLRGLCSRLEVPCYEPRHSPCLAFVARGLRPSLRAGLVHHGGESRL